METALVTGGTGALGQAVVAHLIGSGYACVVPYRNGGEAQKLLESIAPQMREHLLLLEADMTDPAAIADVFSTCDSFGGLYALVHLLGGIRGFTAVSETEIEDWDAIMNLNLRSFFLASRLAMQRFMRFQRGRIVSIGAMAALKPSATQNAYAVAKAGVVALTRILADEGRAIGVTANCIAPSIIRTQANLEWGSPESAASWVTPQEIATTISYLMGSDARSVNGTVIRAFGKMNL